MEPGKFLVIHQPQFNPYLGVLAKYYLASRIVHLDTVQFVKGEFQNRNKILLGGEPHWLTVPVIHRFGQQIHEVQIDSRVPWQRKHLGTLEQAYHAHPRFGVVFPSLENLYQAEPAYLVEWNLLFLSWLFQQLGIGAQTQAASELGDLPTGRDERLIAICQKLEMPQYLAGANGLWYMRRELWDQANVSVQFIRYLHPQYDQGIDGFHSHVGVLDLLFRFPPDQIREIALSGAVFLDWQPCAEPSLGSPP